MFNTSMIFLCLLKYYFKYNEYHFLLDRRSNLKERFIVDQGRDVFLKKT